MDDEERDRRNQDALNAKIAHMELVQEEILEAIEARIGKEHGKAWAELVRETGAVHAVLIVAAQHFDNPGMSEKLEFASACVEADSYERLSDVFKMPLSSFKESMLEEFNTDVESFIRQCIGSVSLEVDDDDDDD